MGTFGTRENDSPKDSAGNVLADLKQTFYASRADAEAQANPLGSATTGKDGRFSFSVDGKISVFGRDPFGVIRPYDTEDIGSAASSTYAPVSRAVPGAFVAYLGDSNTAGTGNNGEDFSKVATLLSGSRLRFGGKFGHPGYRSDMLVPFVGSEIVPSGANTCVVSAGTNDAGADVTVTAYMGFMDQIIKGLRASSITPVVLAVPPRFDKRDLVARYNMALSRYCSANAVTFIDIHAVLVDPATGGLTSAVNVDANGVHYNRIGHNLVGKAISDRLSPQVPYQVPWLATENADPTNLLANGLFMSDANADGQADTWVRSVGSATPTYSLVSDARWVGKAQKLAFSANSGYRSFYQSLTGIAPGNRIGMGFVYAIENATLLAGNGFKFQYTWTGPGTQVVSFTLSQNTTRGVWWEEAVAPTGTTGVKFEFVWSGGASDAADYLIGQATCRNLTALGIV